MPQPISIDTASFREIRSKGCIYVDKTAYLYKLANGPNSRYFLSRPRRFGKSLMLSTFKEIFLGNRDLFDGLAIAQTDWSWEKYPVMHFDLSFAASATTADEFAQGFPNTVKSTLEAAGFPYDSRNIPSVNFGNAIDALSKANGDRGVVILIDEYDDPVAKLLGKVKEAEKVRDLLAPFYGQMKGRTEKIRFLMITGVSKFTKMSVFSALSNLIDLSFEDSCATMLGYTDEELDRYFGEHMREHAKLMKLTDEQYRAELKRWFNGYRFGSFTDKTVYNPVSIGWNLYSPVPMFRPSWAETGKSATLMNYLKRDEFLGFDLERIPFVRQQDFDSFDLNNLQTVPMLYQTGYLTIDSCDPRTGLYTLRVPDEEVRQDLAFLSAAFLAKLPTSWVSALGIRMLQGDWPEFFAGLRALFADLPYGPREGAVHEYSYERALLVFLKAQGVQARAEDRQANGQADIVATHPCGVYIFELKVDSSAEAALAQVKSKNYDAPYRGQGKPIWAIGLNFDRQTRQLTDAKAERLSED